MAARSAIEWTDATWNPTRGCTRVSPGCENCYAEALAARFSDEGQWGHGFATRAPARWTRKVELIFTQLERPVRWTEPRRIFVNSTSDLFHEGLSDAAIDEIVFVIAKCAQPNVGRAHTFQVLTKRAARLRRYWHDIIAGRFVSGALRIAAPLPNLWLGVSVEDQERADERIPDLLDTPAAVRFLSCEPLLGPVDLDVSRSPIDWVICGGESGGAARPMDPAWARALRDQCAAAGVAFFFKQWGEWAPAHPELHFTAALRHAGKRETKVWPSGETSIRVGKRDAGRLLDGREHNAAPAAFSCQGGAADADHQH